MLSGFHGHLVHEAKCPEISPLDCAETPIPDHTHDQRITFVNVQSSFLYRFDSPWQLFTTIPFLIRKQSIEYYLIETGEEYEPPYAGIHHRNETLSGLGDPELLIQRFVHTEDFNVGFSMGSTIPFGKTEENPYALGAQSKVHQHFQMGTGSFVPVAELYLVYPKEGWGLLGQTRLMLPFYENSKGYKIGNSYSFDLGYWAYVRSKVNMFAQIQYFHKEPDYWLDLPAPFSTKMSLEGVLATRLRVRSNKEFLLSMQRSLIDWTPQEKDSQDGESMPVYWVISVGISFL
ncbi:MAG: hypothetical protein CMK59_07315 [Proteobacteria bacterium]|nr:hypothetical protein [Pseudomonadota bacterium]